MKPAALLDDGSFAARPKTLPCCVTGCGHKATQTRSKPWAVFYVCDEHAAMREPAEPARCSHNRTLTEPCFSCTAEDEAGDPRCIHGRTVEQFCECCELRGAGAFITEVR